MFTPPAMPWHKGKYLLQSAFGTKREREGEEEGASSREAQVCGSHVHSCRGLEAYARKFRSELGDKRRVLNRQETSSKAHAQQQRDTKNSLSFTTFMKFAPVAGLRVRVFECVCV